MNRKWVFIIGSLLFIGCQSAQNHSFRDQPAREVSFISFPPGAVIEIDGVYKGRTPSIVILDGYHSGEEGRASYYKVFIHPGQEEGYCMQRTVLDPGDLPEEVFFDLTQCSGEDNRPSILPNGNLGVHPDTQTF